MSSKEQEKEGFSIPAQRKLLQQYALDHGLEIVREWEQELADLRRDTALHESAGHDYMAKGSKILELAQTAPAQFLTQNPAEQAQLLLSNCSFESQKSFSYLG